MTDTYYSKNKHTVLEKQRAKRNTPEAKARTREYSRHYYQKNRDNIIAKIQERKQKKCFDFTIERGSYVIDLN
jgi:hypothetical protein